MKRIKNAVKIYAEISQAEIFLRGEDLDLEGTGAEKRENKDTTKKSRMEIQKKRKLRAKYR